MSHNWSGWPGAWCLDCGVEDIGEQAVGCRDCDIGYPGCSETLCELHSQAARGQQECPEPGSGRFNPYRKHRR